MTQSYSIKKKVASSESSRARPLEVIHEADFHLPSEAFDELEEVEDSQGGAHARYCSVCAEVGGKMIVC